MKTIHASDLIVSFRRLPDNAFFDHIIFYKKNFRQIQNLEFEEYAEIKYSFVKAMFYVENYFTFEKQSEQLLYEIINHHHFHHTLRHIYEKLIYLRATYYGQQQESSSSLHHFRELYKLNTSNPKYRKLLFHQLFLQNLKSYANWFTVVVLLLICTLGIIFIQNFVIHPFFHRAESVWNMARNLCFLSSLVMYLAINAIAGVKAKSEMKAISNKNKQLRNELN